MKSKKVTTIFSIVLVLSLFALFVWAFPANTDINNVAVDSPITGQNISSTLTFNISAHALRPGDGSAANLTSDGNVTNVTIEFANATNVSRQDVVLNFLLLYNDITLNNTFNNA